MMSQSSVIRTLGVFALTIGSAFAQRVDSIPFRANLSPLNEIPIIEDLNASGSATVWIHAVRAADGTITSASVDFNVRYNFPAGIRITGLHIHRGTAAVNGPVVIDSGIRGAEPLVDEGGRGSITRQAAVTSEAGLAAVNGMLANPDNFYVNLHTTDNPGGAIRGQTIRATQTILMTSLSPANEVPPVTGLNASGTATILQVAGRDPQGRLSAEVIFDVQYTGFPEGTRFTGLHIHAGPTGVNGPVTIDSGLRGPIDAPTSGTGSLRFIADVNTSNANSVTTVNALPGRPDDFYVNLHTTVNPGGAIRGQLQQPDRALISAIMTPGEEVPPIADLNASAAAQALVAALRNDAGTVTAGTVIFNVSPVFPGATTFTGLHIHEGPAGQNGPVRIDSGIRADSLVVVPGGIANIYRIAPVTSAAGLAALNGLLLNPANYYLNLHTTVNPGGAVRAQMGSGTTALPTITEVGGLAGQERVSTAAVGGRLYIRGSNLAFAAGSSVGVVGGREPTNINGTSVTVSGVPAFVISVAPDLIIARVPPGVGIGPLPVTIVPVIVTNRNGGSNVANLTVSPAAY